MAYFIVLLQMSSGVRNEILESMIAEIGLEESAGRRQKQKIIFISSRTK